MWQADWSFGLLGGLMIGAAAALLLVANGRIMGASGILGGLVDGSGRAEARERLAFLAGLVGVPALVALARGAPPTNATTSLGLLMAAGLLVGIGTRIGSGCTSGHGVCGMARLSPRSIAATVVFLVSGGMTMLVGRHVLGLI